MADGSEIWTGSVERAYKRGKAEGYQEGLEAAARVCEQYAVAARSTHRYFESEGKEQIAATWDGGATACEQLAQDIRALKADKPTG